jgi:hypothetical protein
MNDLKLKIDNSTLFIPDGTMVKFTDVRKLHSLGWKHKVELEDGIKSMNPHAKQLSTALRNRWLAFGREVGDGATLLTTLSEGKPSLPREGNSKTTLSKGELSLVRERV